MRILFSLLILIFCVSCQHVAHRFTSGKLVRKDWVLNTLSEPYLQARVLQRAKTLLTKDLILQADSLYGVRAYDRLTGNLQWYFSVLGGIEGGLAVDKDRVVFGGSDGFFYCLEVKTGLMLWKFYTGVENLGEPFVKDGLVYFLTSKDKLYSLNIKTGQSLWTYKLDSVNTMSIRGVGRPMVDHRFVYAGFSNGLFVALNKKTGQWVWRVQLSKNGKFKDVDVSPVVTGNHVYAASYDGGLYSLNKDTGRVVWHYKEGSHNAPTVNGSHLYYSSTKGNIVALNRFSGKPLWTHKVKGLATRPILYKSFLIYGTSKGDLNFLKSDKGVLIHTLNLFRGVKAEPAVDSLSQQMYVMSVEAWLYKFSLLF